MTRQLISLGILSSTFVFGQTLTPRELFNKFPARPAVATPDKKPPQPAISAPGMNNASIAKPGKQPTAPNTHNSTVATLVGYSPLGLRYSLLHSSEGASYSEVDADTVFRSGDKLKVTAQSNDPAHLYVISRGSSGNWKVLFPSAEVGGGDNRVAAMQSYNIPPTGNFLFDENPGEEKLFVILSRKPVNDLESMIYDLGKKPKEAAPEKTGGKPMMLAQRIKPIDDAMVGRLRAGVQSRDLVFEKVDEKTTGPKKEKAVYVVNTKSSPDSQLIVDLTLRHR